MHATATATSAATKLGCHLVDESHHLRIVLVLHDVRRVGGDVLEGGRHLRIGERGHHLRVVEKSSKASHSTHVSHVILRVLGSFLGSRLSSLLGFPDPLLLLVQSLLRLLPVLLTLVLCKLLRVGLHLLQPLIRLLVEVDLASSGQVSCGLSEVTKKPVCTASELVSTRIVGVQLNGPCTISNTCIWFLNLNEAGPSLGKHSSRVGIELDCLCE